MKSPRSSRRDPDLLAAESCCQMPERKGQFGVHEFFHLLESWGTVPKYLEQFPSIYSTVAYSLSQPTSTPELILLGSRILDTRFSSMGYPIFDFQVWSWTSSKHCFPFLHCFQLTHRKEQRENLSTHQSQCQEIGPSLPSRMQLNPKISTRLPGTWVATWYAQVHVTVSLVSAVPSYLQTIEWNMLQKNS